MIKLLMPEVYAATSCIILLLFNSHLINTLKLNFPLMEKELLFQSKFILITLFCLLSNNCLGGFDHAQLFEVVPGLTIAKMLLLGAAFAANIFVWRSFLLQRLNFFEYFFISLSTIAASLLLISAQNLLTIYISIEMQSLGFYVLSAFQRQSAYSAEAGLKYFISSAAASGIFLLGCACVYGATGAASIADLHLLCTISETSLDNEALARVGVVLIFCTILFKLVIAPFHVWFPQIYDGAPLASTIFFGIVPKLSLFVLAAKIWLSIGEARAFFDTAMLSVGAYSVAFGIFQALKQKRLKKMFIYSSISQIGLPLCALSEGSYYSVVALFFFLAVYLFTSTFMWGAYAHMGIAQKTAKVKAHSALHIYPVFVTELAGAQANNKTIFLFVSFIFFSLAGIPPCIGFLNKIYIYLNLIQAAHYEFAIALAYVGAFGVFYYIRNIKLTIAQESNFYKTQTTFRAKYLSLDFSIFAILATLIIYFCFYPNSLFLTCAAVAASLM